VRENVLDANKDLDIRVLAVWLPVLGSDTRESATKVTAVLADPRVEQFYDPGAKTGRWFKTNVVDDIKRLQTRRVFGGGITWDAFFLYGPKAKWTKAPKPHLSAGATIMRESEILATAIKKLPGGK
jgi:hypothetical protein